MLISLLKAQFSSIVYFTHDEYWLDFPSTDSFTGSSIGENGYTEICEFSRSKLSYSVIKLELILFSIESFPCSNSSTV
jgi:hypothetical protein